MMVASDESISRANALDLVRRWEMRWTRVVLLGVAVLGLSAAPVVAAVPAAAPDTVQVFFSRNPDSFNDFTAVFPLARTVPGNPGLIEQTLTALIAGPTPAEQAAGYFSDFGALVGSPVSTCKGLDFTLMVAQGTATVQVCRATSSAGVGQDARSQAEVEATLTQFAGVTKVIVLNAAGHCLFDESGLDLCLTP